MFNYKVASLFTGHCHLRQL